MDNSTHDLDDQNHIDPLPNGVARVVIRLPRVTIEKIQNLPEDLQRQWIVEYSAIRPVQFTRSLAFGEVERFFKLDDVFKSAKYHDLANAFINEVADPIQKKAQKRNPGMYKELSLAVMGDYVVHFDDWVSALPHGMPKTFTWCTMLRLAAWIFVTLESPQAVQYRRLQDEVVTKKVLAAAKEAHRRVGGGLERHQPIQPIQRTDNGGPDVSKSGIV